MAGRTISLIAEAESDGVTGQSDEAPRDGIALKRAQPGQKKNPEQSQKTAGHDGVASPVRIHRENREKALGTWSDRITVPDPSSTNIRSSRSSLDPRSLQYLKQVPQGPMLKAALDAKFEAAFAETG